MSSPHTPLLLQSLDQCRTAIRHAIRSFPPDVASSSSSKQNEEQALSPLPSGLSDILLALLSRIKHTTTTLALSFKPPITHLAAVQQLDKIADEYNKITSCVLSAQPLVEPQFSLLVAEWKEGAQTLGEEIERLITVLRSATEVEPTASSSSSSNENPYLAHTGMVWDAIDRMSDLSTTENGALIRIWKGRDEMVKDAWVEFKEFLEDQADGDTADRESGNQADDGEEADDEWGELEKSMSLQPMTAEERACALAAKPIFALHQILHATVSRYLPLLVMDPETPYTSLYTSSSAFTSAFDTAISVMYPRQSATEVDEGVALLHQTSQQLISNLRDRLAKITQPAHDEQMQCITFLDRWEARCKSKLVAWGERRLSVASLGDAL